MGRLTIYHTYIISNFNYCPVVWHFCGESNTKKMEKIQERTLRFIYENLNSDYDTLLLKSQNKTSTNDGHINFQNPSQTVTDLSQ